ncbi:ABC transporter permease [Bifidobacterium samirii]|nr:FtsX-like permease family protein [Bifidobacterium samirii]
MTNRRMFLTMLWGAVFRRRSRAIMAVIASMVGSATLFCLAAVCIAVPQQMNEEMRAYGANLIVTPAASGSGSSGSTGSTGSTRTGSDSAGSASTGIDESDERAVTAIVADGRSAKAASYRYENVRINAAPYTIAGIDTAAVRDLNRHWSVDGDWPSAGAVMLGRDVADALDVTVGATVTIAYRADADADATTSAGASEADGTSGTSGSSAAGSVAGQTRDGRVSTDIMETGGTELRVAGIVDTGGSEDLIVYADADDVTALAGSSRGADVVEYSVNAVGDDLAAVVDAVNAADLGVAARQVTRITASDTRIITMLRTLFWIVSLVVLALTLVGVGTTIGSIVSQRRNEIGLRKALGADSRAIAVEFVVESALYGLIGGLVGTAIGYVLARMLCVGVFDRAIGFDWPLGIASVLLAALVAVAASIPPVRRATRIDPAVVLREE